MAAPIVWINGFPGSGKLTVAKTLAILHRTIFIMDNHKLIDPVEASIPRDHPDYQKARWLQRKAAFDKYVCGAAMYSTLIVFTDFQSNNELGKSVAAEYKDAARKASRPFVPIYLTCDLKENLERVTSLDRVRSGTKKLTSAEILNEFRSRCELFRFDDCQGLTVDVTSTTPLMAATKILTFVNKSNVTAATSMP